MVSSTATVPVPNHNVPAAKVPGHWLLARMGKRVLRPGGLELTNWMQENLDITSADDVVELAPGMGATARLTLSRHPASYTAVERDSAAASGMQSVLRGPQDRCVHGSAAETGLPSESADVAYGEAMLTMQPASAKSQIVAEAARVLRPGGRYGIHELALRPGNLPQSIKDEILYDLSAAIHVNARPLTCDEWCELLQQQELDVDPDRQQIAPMHLLEPRRMLQDEGLFRTLRIGFNVLCDSAARQRILQMRRAFRKHSEHLCAISLVAQKCV